MNLPSDEQSSMENAYINKKIQEDNEFLQKMSEYMHSHPEFVKEFAVETGWVYEWAAEEGYFEKTCDCD